MELLTYLMAIFVGFFIGFMGSGGGILTVPFLVYVQGIKPVLATGYSLFIVGVTALFSILTHKIQDKKILVIAFLFMIPSVLMIIFTRSYILPNIPPYVSLLGFAEVEKGSLIMLFFSFITILMAFLIIRKSSVVAEKPSTKFMSSIDYIKIGVFSAIEGVISGLIGVGGGFIIIPILVLTIKVTIKEAIIMSLFIISIKSLIGFGVEAFFNKQMDWSFILSFTFFALIGGLIGKQVRKNITEKAQRKIFSIFLVIISSYVFIKEIFF